MCSTVATVWPTAQAITTHSDSDANVCSKLLSLDLFCCCVSAACKPGCETCTSSSNCLGELDGLLILNPLRCDGVGCSANCTACNATACNLCQTGYMLESGVCNSTPCNTNNCTYLVCLKPALPTVRPAHLPPT